MRNSLMWKLILAFLLVAIIAAVLVAVFIRLTSVDRLTQLIVDQQTSRLQAALSEYYQDNGSWNGISDQWGRILFSSLSGVQAEGTSVAPQDDRPPIPDRQQPRDRRSLFGLADSQGRVIVPTGGNLSVGQRLTLDELRSGTPVEVNGQVVGTILIARLPTRFNPEEALFLQRTTEALIFAALAALLVALVVGVILARTLISPLRALTHAAQNIAQGELQQQVDVRSNDEIGQLARAFNIMSQEVSRVNQQRKQMTADIAHDLRTPLTVIAGYVESMHDGVLQPTPERLELIYTEIERLQNLVGDLKMLSQVDSGELPLHPQRIAPKSLLEHAAAPFQHRAAQQQVDLCIDASENLPEVRVDEGRMMQVFGNLLSNALRYTPIGGKILLAARRENGSILLAVEDNGSGIAEEDLPFIFDRFHRSDKSRHSEAGESGLGLAIVKALVEAHGGAVRAESGEDTGTRIIIQLPIPATA